MTNVLNASHCGGDGTLTAGKTCRTTDELSSLEDVHSVTLAHPLEHVIQYLKQDI